MAYIVRADTFMAYIVRADTVMAYELCCRGYFVHETVDAPTGGVHLFFSSVARR